MFLIICQSKRAIFWALKNFLKFNLFSRNAEVARPSKQRRSRSLVTLKSVAYHVAKRSQWPESPVSWLTRLIWKRRRKYLVISLHVAHRQVRKLMRLWFKEHMSLIFIIIRNYFLFLRFFKIRPKNNLLLTLVSNEFEKRFFGLLLSNYFEPNSRF